MFEDLTPSEAITLYAGLALLKDVPYDALVERFGQYASIIQQKAPQLEGLLRQEVFVKIGQ